MAVQKLIYINSIEDYSKAIELDPNLVMAYNNRAGSYYYLGEINNAITDGLTCLYICIKQKRVEPIHGELLKLLDAYPQNILYTFEQLQLGISSYFSSQSAIDKITDFELLLEFYEHDQKLKGRELLSAKALLYYHLGGNVRAFCIYDEELDAGDNPMSAQELYYYALTAHEIGRYEAAAISEDNINRIKSKTDKTDEERYYLGLLYLLIDDEEAAKEEFEKSSAYPFSALMLKDSVDDDYFNSFVLGGEIDIDKGIEQFSDYFHYMECYSHWAERPDLWEAFTFKPSFNGENIRERKKEAEEIIAGLMEKYESDAENALGGLSKDKKAMQIFGKINDEGQNNIFKYYCPVNII